MHTKTLMYVDSNASQNPIKSPFAAIKFSRRRDLSRSEAPKHNRKHVHKRTLLKLSSLVFVRFHCDHSPCSNARYQAVTHVTLVT